MAFWFYKKTLSVMLITLLIVSIITVEGENQTVVDYPFTEERPNDTYIGNLMEDAGLNLKIAPEFHSDVVFQFLQESFEYKAYFEIQDGTGIFKTKSRLDRDTMDMCRFTDDCEIPLFISIRQGDYFEIIKIIIHLEDVNDNKPEFPPGAETKELEISELTEVGVPFAIPAATDKDSSKFGIQRYILETSFNNFELEVGNSGADPRLLLKHELDRESQDYYSMKVLAVDGGVPALTGTMTIEISVTDANDNPPTFTNHTYTVTIEENTPKDTPILQVQAFDTDAGDNGHVVYTFSQASQTAFGHLFALNPNTGAILVKGSIDYDQSSSISHYSLGVVASDSGESSRSDYATVNIYIKDVNDNEPQIVINDDGLSNNSVYISESARIDSFVAHISVIDPDKGPSGEVECHLDHAFFLLVEIYDKQYKLVTAATLDRESSHNQFRVTVMCQDKGDSPLTAMRNIKVVVTDENDHSPVFQRQSYPVSVRENNQINVQLTQVQADDDDIGENARITYSILPPHDQILDIDETNGFLRAKSVFDYEIVKSYEVTITASDHGSEQLSANTTVVITVLDSNDEPPRFNHTHYTFGTLENQHAGTEVGVVEATDRDSTQFSDIIYTIDTTSPHASYFKIPDQQIGKITLRKVFDREQQDKYSILVIASNPGYSLHTVANVTIFVGDDNDNSPQLQFPTSENNRVQISSRAERGDLVVQILANDSDVGRNSYLKYSILAGNIHSIFTINPNSGEIIVNKSLDDYRDRDIRMSILVKDRGEPPLSVIADLEVYINSSAMASPQPASRSTTNLQLIIILVLSVLAISLFLAVLIVLVTMRQKKKAKQQENNRYKLNITFAPVNGSNRNSGSGVSEPNSVTNSPATERKDDVVDGNGKESRGYDGIGQPPPYTETVISSKMTYLNPDGTRSSDPRKVHFAETDSAYDSIDKEEEEQQQNNPAGGGVQYLQQQGGAVARPTYMEQQRQRLLYRSAGAPRTPEELHIQNHMNADVESDQGSSIDSGRGPSEDEHGGPCRVSFIPDPHTKNKIAGYTNKPTAVLIPPQRSYPDLVNCTCGGGNINNKHSHKKLPSHSKGCPQRLSPKNESSPTKSIGSLNDFQNLLGLPPKTYNKKIRKGDSFDGQRQSGRLHSSGSSRLNSDGSGSSLSHSNNSGRVGGVGVEYIPPHIQHNNNNPPHVNDSIVNNNPVVNNYHTQQCYDDIAQQKKSKYSNGTGSASHTSSRNSSHPNSHNSRNQHRNSSSGNSHRSYGGADSDCESVASGGSTTTSGSFTVGSVMDCQSLSSTPLPPVIGKPPVQQIHQVYV